MKKTYSLLVAFVLAFTVAGCSSRSGTGTFENPENGGEDAVDGKTWQSDGSTITIDSSSVIVSSAVDLEVDPQFNNVGRIL